MDYSLVYDKICSNARSREGSCSEPTEEHHVVPICLGGEDTKENIITLTLREHVVVHLLLVKMYKANVKLICSANMLNNRLYGGKCKWVKNLFSKFHPNKSAENRAKISEARKGKSFITESGRKSLSEKTSEDWVRRFGEHGPNFGKAFPESAKKILSECNSGEGNPFHGEVHTEETKAKMRGVNHRLSVNWLVISPEGEEFRFTGGLWRFCEGRGLSGDAFKSNVNKGKIKKARSGASEARVKSEGWEIRKL